MGFASDSGYTPSSIETIMLSIMDNINTQFGTTYTTDSFVGTNFYKYMYSMAQLLQTNEIKTSEIFIYLQQYFAITNEKISRPVVTNQGLVDIITAAGYICSVKPMVSGDAGKINICIDKTVASGNWEDSTGYAADKAAAAAIIKNSTCAGCVTQGGEVTTITLSNGQEFDFAYALPNRIPVDLRLTMTLSDNNQVAVATDDDIKTALLANVASRYQLGKDFEPQRYWAVSDSPWASVVLLEWSTDGGTTYFSTVFDANFNDLYQVDLSRLHIVEA